MTRLPAARRYEAVDIEVLDYEAGLAYSFDTAEAAIAALAMFEIGLGELAYRGGPIEQSPAFAAVPTPFRVTH